MDNVDFVEKDLAPDHGIVEIHRPQAADPDHNRTSSS